MRCAAARCTDTASLVVALVDEPEIAHLACDVHGAAAELLGDVVDVRLIPTPRRPLDGERIPRSL